MTTHPMIERIAKAIAEPKLRYAVKYDPSSDSWCICLIEDGENKSVVQNSENHALIETECERLNNELLARLAVEAMLDFTPDMLEASHEVDKLAGFDNLYVGKAGYLAMLNAVLKNE